MGADYICSWSTGGGNACQSPEETDSPVVVGVAAFVYVRDLRTKTSDYADLDYKLAGSGVAASEHPLLVYAPADSSQ